MNDGLDTRLVVIDSEDVDFRHCHHLFFLLFLSIFSLLPLLLQELLHLLLLLDLLLEERQVERRFHLVAFFLLLVLHLSQLHENALHLLLGGVLFFVIELVELLLFLLAHYQSKYRAMVMLDNEYQEEVQ